MTKRLKPRRRVFDIDMPEERAQPRASLVGAPRRGPMATAITETSEALEGRRAAEASIRAENDALAHEHARLKRLGLVVEMIPLNQIVTTKLIRDRRVRTVEEDLDELKASIREIGLSNPIRVEAAPGGYELIQGLRRLTAFRALHEETGDEAYASIPASLTQPGESTEGLYRRMVDENLVRKDVSFAEMAMLAHAYADDPDTGLTSVSEAVRLLFKSASYQKRSYIRAFADLIRMLEKQLNFPEHIPRGLGVKLRDAMRADPDLISATQRALRNLEPGYSAEAEMTVLRRMAGEGAPSPRRSSNAVKPKVKRAAKTQAAVKRPAGLAVGTATNGKFEILSKDDFSTYEPEDLQRAMEAFYAVLEG